MNIPRFNHRRKSDERISPAFTIVELLIVVVVIAILAAITIVSYAGISNNARLSSLKVELSQAAKKLETEKIKSGTTTYPASLTAAGVPTEPNITYNYKGGGTTSYCLSGVYDSYSYRVTDSSNSPVAGSCVVTSGDSIQTVITATCPTTRTMVKDARDNHSYWIQKLADNKCWMLTNLAYAGGGTNTYSDVMPTGDGTGGTLSNGTSDTAATFTSAKYYIPAGANPTTAPTQPSTSTDGGATNPQYGYLYNWCAANKGQSGNGACSNLTSATVDTTKSICPAGWRLPTGDIDGELQALATAIGATNDAAGAMNLRTTWLAQYGGYWYGGSYNQGSESYYWPSTQDGIDGAYYLFSNSSGVSPSSFGSSRRVGQSVRCLAL